jgi:hypothetical protein
MLKKNYFEISYCIWRTDEGLFHTGMGHVIQVILAKNSLKASDKNGIQIYG